MTVAEPTIPSVAETVRAYVRRGVLGDGDVRPGSFLPAGALLMVPLFLPAPDASNTTLGVGWPVLIAGLVSAISSGNRESKFGGPRRLVWTAAATGAAVGSVGIGAFFAGWWLYGGLIYDRIPSGWFSGLPVPIQLLSFAAVFIGIVLASRASWSRWPRAEAEFEALARAERAKRGVRPAR